MDCGPPGSSVHGDSPGKNTGVGCHALLQGIFLTQGLNLSLLRLLHWAGLLFTTSAGEAHWNTLQNSILSIELGLNESLGWQLGAKIKEQNTDIETFWMFLRHCIWKTDHKILADVYTFLMFANMWTHAWFPVLPYYFLTGEGLLESRKGSLLGFQFSFP